MSPPESVIYIPDSPDVIEVPPPPRPELEVVDLTGPSPAELKIELKRVLNAFQASQGYGVFVCEAFRDPRSGPIDDYWYEVEPETSGIWDLYVLCGKHSQPLSGDARAAFGKFSRTLASLAARVDAVLAHS